MTNKQKYQEKYRKKNREKRRRYSNDYYAKHKKERRCYSREYYAKNKNGKVKRYRKERREFILAYQKKYGKSYYEANKEYLKQKQREYRITRAEYLTVYEHYQHINVRSTKTNKFKGYYKMPFFGGWDPKKGGSFRAGADWIIKNLGKRPDENHQLHIVDRKIGFMPNNLEWVSRGKHRQEELVNKLLLENRKLKLQLKKFIGKEI